MDYSQWIPFNRFSSEDKEFFKHEKIPCAAADVKLDFTYNSGITSNEVHLILYQKSVMYFNIYFYVKKINELSVKSVM